MLKHMPHLATTVLSGINNKENTILSPFKITLMTE
jgi:hypothetical protein